VAQKSYKDVVRLKGLQENSVRGELKGKLSTKLPLLSGVYDCRCLEKRRKCLEREEEVWR
jgi:hypothetical protein